MAEKELGLTIKKEQDFSEWYTQLIQKSDLADYTPVSGCIVFKPRAFAVWEKIVDLVDNKFKKLGIKNVYFPLFIPEKLLNKEKEHVQGFSPEVAWVTQAGNTKLNEKLAVRPTSEAIMYDSFSKWVRSWRDLPIKYNQWSNVVRWEFTHSVPFLRTREFIFNELHTVLSTEKEALEEGKDIIEVYRDICENYLALYGIYGRKTENEKFAGAVFSEKLHYIMPNGKTIEGPCFHHDGQNFAKAYDIKFIDKNEKESYVWQNTYALSTRMLGVMFSIHSDDKGLVLPPRMAEEKIVIVPILFDKGKDKVLSKCKELKKKLEKYNAILDDREDYSPGWKFNNWELKGIPIRIELGPKDLEKNGVMLVRRDGGEKSFVKFTDVEKKVEDTLEKIQENLFNKSKEFLEKSIKVVKNKDEYKKALNDKKLIKACWCDDRSCEDKIKEETGSKCIVIPSKQEKISGDCFYCGKKAKLWAYFGKSY